MIPVVEAHPIKLNGEIKLIGVLESSLAHLNGTETTGVPEEVRSDVFLEDDGGNDIKIKEKQLNETVIHNQESFENGELHLNGDSRNADYEGTSEIASAQEGKELLKVAPDGDAVPERVLEILTSETPIMERELISEAEEADEGVMENSSSTGGIKGPRTPILEFERETVSIEEVGDSDSSDSDENKPSMDQPVQKSTTGPLPPSRPAGLGSSAPLPDPTPRVSAHLQQQQSTRRVNGSVISQPSDDASATIYSEPEEGSDETREKLQMIRVKFLRLAHRLGQTPHNVVVAQVLYRLGLAEQLRGSHSGRTSGGAFSFDRASAMAEQLEAAGQEALDFSCTIMIIGKTGVGKTATINSIFDEVKFRTDAFQAGTTKVQDIVGTVQGINVRVIDTPGLSSAYSDQRKNEKILHSVKRFINKTPPDIVLYLDRLDMQSRDHGDISLLRAITDVFGPLIWFNAIVVLTHAASAPPDGPNGAPLSYEMFVSQRSHVIQQAIRQAAGDARLMNPVALVENHSACRTNRAGQRVLPNGQVWKPQLLLLSFASKILAEANMLLKLEDSPPVRPFQTRGRVPPLPFLLSTLLQSRPPLRLPEEQFAGEDSLDEDSDDGSESGDEPEYDELPPFRRLTKAQLAKLSRAQKKAYFEELDYREKLFMKKQMKEEKKRRRFLKKMEEAASSKDTPPSNVPSEGMEEDGGSNATLPVAMPDLTLPNSFDSDSPSYRYRFLDSNSPWLVRAVLDSQGWDHEVGYDGLSFERLFVAKEKVPVSVTGQLTKDKKDFNLQMELAGSINHSEGHATSMGLDMQTVGKDMLCTLRGETGFTILKRNKTTLGVSATRLGDALMAGLKVEDNLVVNKRLKLLMSGGMMTGRGDVAYGGRLEATLRDKDYPLGKTLSTLALSIVDWHGDLAIACNTQLQFPVERATNVVFHGNLSNKGTGQIGIRLNSTEHLQIALVALVPLFRNIKRLLYSNSQSM
ncbi:hypothetical protein QJS10_CPA01g00416 [Acorus calamus]|uniref:AIG1-type G domain-containing protein n=1 Tax=Acorus calamus TaxID=4465 RepID=A0AAV9FGN9_ACOCL|nr:hypothetical protein QJS10_CPA01g00416 [Acorus calamus]